MIKQAAKRKDAKLTGCRKEDNTMNFNATKEFSRPSIFRFCRLCTGGVALLFFAANALAQTLGTTARLEGASAGVDSVVLAVTPSSISWTNTANDSWLHLDAANQSGTGSTNIIFGYDFNSGATRSGTLTIAGQTLTVTQAGSTYVAAGGVTTLVPTGLSLPGGVALDGAGNVYLADYGNNAIKKWTSANNSVTTLVSSGLSNPVGVAVDGAGNVYIADTGNNAIKEWTAADSTVTTLISSGLNGPQWVVVDGAGNLYITDTGNNAIKKWTAANNTVSTLVSGLNQPNELAVDAAGNVYVGDYNNSAIEKWTAANSNLTTLVSGLTGVDGVAVDGAGNLYASDYADGAIRKWTAANGAVTTLVSSGLYRPIGMAVDGTGNVYFADTWNNAVKELPYAFVDPTPKLESVAAGTDTLPVVLPATENLLPPFASVSDLLWLTITGVTNDVVSFSFPANPSTPRTAHISLLGQIISVTQQGVTNTVTNYVLGTTALLEGPGTGMDSVVLAVTPNSASWTNTANDSWLHLDTNSENGTGSTNVIFSYDANPGSTRSGTLTIAGQTLTVTQAGSTYVAAGAVTTLVSSSALVNGVAVDSAGNVYFSGYYANTLDKWTASNNTVATLSSGLSGPQGVALDGVGNVYIGSLGDGTIKEWVAANSNLITLVSSDLNYPEGVAVDGAGNVYIGDTFNNALKEWSAATGTVTTLASSGLNQPNGVAVDAAGNVYVVDNINSAIDKWTAANNTLSTLVSNLVGVDGVAVDGAGNVYVANYNESAMQKWTAASNTVTTLISSGLYQPETVAVDATGNVYIADTYNNAVKELPYAFVDPTSKPEGTAAGSDSLPMVLPATENLLAPFAPTSDSSWLTVTGVTNGVVSFSFTATTAARVGHITLLGQSISVLQDVILPAITTSPTNQTVVAGSSVTFSGSATGSAPLAFQWQFDGTNVGGATNTSLTLNNVLATNSGSYTLVVTNAYGSATSSVALLNVEETTIYLVTTNPITTNSSPNSDTIVVPIDMTALGTETALGFTLNFNPNLLTFQSVVVGSGASGGAPILNTNQAASGVLGLGIDMFSGTFTAGTDDVFEVTFQIATLTNWATNTFSYSSTPIAQLVSDAQAQALPTVWTAGTLVLAPSELEGDDSPRPNGNEVVNISDWVQEARFVVGLDTASNGLEFQRADCAPRDTLGDGQITVADWVQVGRYAAGLDPITAVGGPTSPVDPDFVRHDPIKLGGSRLVSLVPVVQGAMTNTVAVQLTAQGNESGLGFTVTFDPALMRFVSAALGTGANGASLAPNTTNAANGVLGFLVGYLPPSTFAAGTGTVLNLTFASIAYTNTSALAFANAPVVCQLADTNAAAVSTTFQNGALAIAGSPWPSMSISQNGTNLVLTWPTSGAGTGGLQTASSLEGPWSNVVAVPSTNGESLEITTSVSTNSQYFRLKY